MKDMVEYIKKCPEVKRAQANEYGLPEFGDGWCNGYQKSEMNDEPTEACDACEYYAGKEG